MKGSSQARSLGFLGDLQSRRVCSIALIFPAAGGFERNPNYTYAARRGVLADSESFIS